MLDYLSEIIIRIFDNLVILLASRFYLNTQAGVHTERYTEYIHIKIAVLYYFFHVSHIHYSHLVV